MRIAIVAPSPVPFMLGGAERLWQGLLDALNESTPHQADLIKLPLREHSLPDLMDGYEAFSRLDLSHFDMVVSSKYPGWMVDHPNHVVYMLHTLRGLYDTYRGAAVPDLDPGDATLVRLRALLQSPPRRETLNDLFGLFRRLVAERGPQHPLFAFPGPLARELVHHLDAVALTPGRIARYLAISSVVAARPGYFPPGVAVEAVHPPSNLRGFRCGGFSHIVTASRLDGPKRVDLLLDAMRFVDAPVRCLIAGTGPEEERLRRRAADDPRVELLGRVSDQRLLDLYADALAVPFLPRDEDFGLVALEAMRSGKPVVTCVDGGGPTELVQHGVTGLVVPPRAPEVGAALNRLVRDPALARRLGAAARVRGEAVTWETTVQAVLGERPVGARAGRRTRRRVVVVSTFPIHPQRGGGQIRCAQLYRGLTDHFDVEAVSLTEPAGTAGRFEIAPGFVETVVRMGPQHDLAVRMRSSQAGTPLHDILAAELADRSPAYLDALRDALSTAAGVVLAHPYLDPVVAALRPDLPVVYDAHNAEVTLKRSILPAGRDGDELLARVRRIEGGAAQRARLVVTCSTEDGATLAAMYGVPPERFVDVPNGVDVSGVVPVDPEVRAERRRAWLRLHRSHGGYAGARHLGLFVGSWHPPNIQAAEVIAGSAADLPDLLVLLAGGHAEALWGRHLPASVVPAGIVTAPEMALLLGTADVALNPMLEGSGTNLKVVEYMAAGLAVVSTPLGVRGIAAQPGEHLVVATVDGFAGAVRGLLDDPERRAALGAAGRRLVEECYDWSALRQRFAGAVADALGEAGTRRARHRRQQGGTDRA